MLHVLKRRFVHGMVLGAALLAQELHSNENCIDIAGSLSRPPRASILGPVPHEVSLLLESLIDSPKVFRAGVRETHSVSARKIELRGKFFPVRLGLDDNRNTLRFSPKDDKNFFNWGGEKFVEATNPSSFTLKNSEGIVEEFLLPRAVVPYKNTVRPGDGLLNGPEGYYSHIPILKRNGSQWDFQDFLIKSRPEKHFYFEDPRISGPIFDSNGKEQYLLGGTDYSRHVPGEENLFVRNVMYPLEFKNGRLQPLPVDPTSGKPTNSFYVSPTPQKMKDGWRAVDAKNGLITQTDDGAIVVHTRFRVEPSDDPAYAALKAQYGDKVPSWKYSIQAFRFKNYEEFMAYDWDEAMGDLLGQNLGLKATGAKERVVPQAKIILKDSELKDFIPEELRVPGKPLGMGNGARRVRLERRGQSLYASFHKKGEQMYVGEVPKDLQNKGNFILEEGEVSYLAPDHQLGYFKDVQHQTKENRGTKRVYSGMMTLYDQDAMNLKAVYANVVQPLEPHQIAGTGGILDLNHAAYFMGANIVADPKNPSRHVLRAYAGAADAHSESFDFDLVKLMSEMSPGSERWKSGQVYKPE